MPRRPFDYKAFVAGWRAIAADHGIDPVSGQYNYADDAGWWKRDPLMWIDQGPAHSCVERDAISSIATQARAAHGLAEPRTLADVVQDAWREDGASRSRQLVMPLRELHAKRGLTIETIAGMRLEVAIKLPA
jgi:hypothetical protein